MLFVPRQLFQHAIMSKSLLPGVGEPCSPCFRIESSCDKPSYSPVHSYIDACQPFSHSEQYDWTIHHVEFKPVGSMLHASSQGLSSHYTELLQGLNAGLQALPTAFRAHQKALGQFAAALLASPLLSAAVRGKAARTFSLLPRLTGVCYQATAFPQLGLVPWLCCWS